MKRIVTMQDISCLGKCSMTVILPVLSAMGVECAVLPTAVLSTHTAFPSPAVQDLSAMAAKTMDHWATLNPNFSGILTGYLGNPAQAALARELMDRFAAPNTVIVVDPAMGDHGHLYSGIGPEMVKLQATLCARADLCLPNITEAAMMTGLPCREDGDIGYLRELAAAMDCHSIMITGAEAGPGKTGFYWSDGTNEFLHSAQKLPRSCHGTGDLFAAVVMGGMMTGRSARDAGILAAEFVRRAIAATPADSRYGVAFEPELSWLMEQI